MTTRLTQRDISRIEECHPFLQKLFYAAAKDTKCPPFMVVDGARTYAEQLKHYRNGATKTMRSRHLVAENGWSHAIDIAPLIKGKLSWEWKHYKPLTARIKQLAIANGIVGLEWGGDWRSFKDSPHWQLSWKLFGGTQDQPDLIEYVDIEVHEVNKALSRPPVQLVPKNNFLKCIPLVLKHEGGFTNDKADRGGPTNKGITLRVFKKYIKPSGTIKDLKALTQEQARDVFKRYYWDACRCDELPSGVDHAVFDFAVNSGNRRSITFIQSLVGVPADGVLGPITLKAIVAVNPGKLVDMLCDARKEYIIERVASGKLDKKFKRGILNRITRVRREALKIAGANSYSASSDTSIATASGANSTPVTNRRSHSSNRSKRTRRSTHPHGKSLIQVLFNVIKVLLGGK